MARNVCIVNRPIPKIRSLRQMEIRGGKQGQGKLYAPTFCYRLGDAESEADAYLAAVSRVVELGLILSSTAPIWRK